MLVLAPRGGAFGHARAIAAVGADVDYVRLAASSGRIVAAWNQAAGGGKAAVRYAIGDARGRFDPVRKLVSSYPYSNVDVAADRNGNMVISYETPVSRSANAQLAAAVLPRNATTFNAPQVISQDTQKSLSGSEAAGNLYVGPGGLAAGYSVAAVLPWRMQVATLQDDLSFSTPQTVGTVDNQVGNHGFYGPAVALPATGAAVATWAPYDTGCGECDEPKTGEVDAAVRQPDGSFATPNPLSRNASRFVQAAATTNLAIIVWGEGAFDQERLRYSVHTADGRFTQSRLLDRHVLRDPALAGAGHHAVVAWISGHTLRAAQLTD
jgi:hypothetical protein